MHSILTILNPGPLCVSGPPGDDPFCPPSQRAWQGRREKFRAPGQKIRLGPLVSGAPKAHD